MKKFTGFIFATALAAVSCLAQGITGYTQYSTGGAKYNNTSSTNYAVITTESKTGGEPIVTYLNATSDLSSSVVQFYISTNKCTSVFAPGFTNTTTIYYVNSTNLFVPGDLVVIEHMNATNTYNIPSSYEMGFLSTFGAAVATNVVNSGGATGSYTNYVYTMTNAVAAVSPIQIGDNIYQMTKGGNIPVGATTITPSSAGGLYSGRRGSPLLMVLTGTSACTINAASAQFAP